MLPYHYRYIKKCLGNEQRMAENPNEWVTLPQAMAEHGHDEITLLKIDIEGGEYDVLPTMRIGSRHVPMQIAVELHFLDLVRYGILLACVMWLYVCLVALQPPAQNTRQPLQYVGTSAHNNPNDFTNTFW